uniref:Uncharacterized protein n=1 Tax=Setaria viridis TaxID=4556 RepID=A0A4U6TKH0_SETVI|nr:hypothetical protein SEVIR_8G185450v2 [Setaria viridis]
MLHLSHVKFFLALYILLNLSPILLESPETPICSGGRWILGPP